MTKPMDATCCWVIVVRNNAAQKAQHLGDSNGFFVWAMVLAARALIGDAVHIISAEDASADGLEVGSCVGR